MEHRGSGNDHVVWARKLKELLQALGSYVKQHHARGPAWNASGVPLSQFSGAQQQPTCCLPSPGDALIACKGCAASRRLPA